MSEVKASLESYRHVAINLIHMLRNERRVPTGRGWDEETIDELAERFEKNKPLEIDDSDIGSPYVIENNLKEKAF